MFPFPSSLSPCPTGQFGPGMRRTQVPAVGGWTSHSHESCRTPPAGAATGAALTVGEIKRYQTDWCYQAEGGEAMMTPLLVFMAPPTHDRSPTTQITDGSRNTCDSQPADKMNGIGVQPRGHQANERQAGGRSARLSG